MDVLQQLFRDEGFVPWAYQDHKGYLTIGVGHLIDKRKGGRISAKVAYILLQDDVAEKTIDIRSHLPWALSLSEARFGVLQNMCFMLGIAGLLEFKRTLQAIRDGLYDEAAAHLLDSEMAREQKELAGDRETRCERLAKQLITGEWV